MMWTHALQVATARRRRADALRRCGIVFSRSCRTCAYDNRCNANTDAVEVQHRRRPKTERRSARNRCRGPPRCGVAAKYGSSCIGIEMVYRVGGTDFLRGGHVVLGMMRKEKGKVIGQGGLPTLCRVSCAGLCAAAVPVLRHYRTRGPPTAAAGCASDTTLTLAPQERCAPRLYTCLAYPRQFMYQRELKQYRLRIESHLQIKHQKSMTSSAYKGHGSGKNSGGGMRETTSHTASHTIPDEN